MLITVLLVGNFPKMDIVNERRSHPEFGIPNSKQPQRWNWSPAGIFFPHPFHTWEKYLTTLCHVPQLDDDAIVLQVN